MPELALRSDQRVGFIGRTGSGKTFLAQAMLAPQPRVLVIDDKQRVDFPGYFLTTNPTAALVEDKTILRPGKKLTSGFWEDAMYTIHEKGGGIVYVDELAVRTTPSFMDEGMKNILRLGNQLGVGFWWAAQSATEVFNTAIRQADVLILFQNIGASDRDKIIKTAGDIGEVTRALSYKNYEFVVFESDGEPYDSNAIPAYKLVAPIPAHV